MQETKLSTKWLIKIVIFLVASSGLGAWGLYDALIKYPARGEASAQWSLKEYLAAAQESGDFVLVSVDDPVATLESLELEEAELRELSTQGSGLSARQATTKLKRLDWLDALRNVGHLDPANTTIENPSKVLQDLELDQANKNPPKPLSRFDLPMQWVFVVGGFSAAAWLVLLTFSVARKKHRYDPETLTLTLHGGIVITPDLITQVDKRKWDKFLVTLRLKDGSSHRLDLLRYTPLEEWILEMEKQTEGYEPDDEPADEDAESKDDGAGDSQESEPEPAESPADAADDSNAPASGQ